MIRHRGSGGRPRRIKRVGYTVAVGAEIGERLGGGSLVVDLLATDADGHSFPIVLRWQQTSGTAEQKVPWEVMCLADAVLQGGGRYRLAYLVLGGDGWRLKDYFTSGAMDAHLTYGTLVRVVTLEAFVTRADRAMLPM